MCAGAQNDKCGPKVTKGHYEDQFAIRKRVVKKDCSRLCNMLIQVFVPIVSVVEQVLRRVTQGLAWN